MAVGIGRQGVLQAAPGRCAADEHPWAAERERPVRSGGRQRPGNRAGIVAVQVGGGPAEGLPLRGDRLDRRDRVHGTVDLGVVRVDQDREPVQAVVGGEHRGLPDLALLQLAVAEQGEDPGATAGETIGEREPGGR